MNNIHDYVEGYENLKTNGEGLIQSIRRRSYTTYSILSEIFGNLNGSIIYINYVKDKTILQVFVNDGGFNETDLKCITEIYNSGENIKTASINGIGIRTSFDKISTSDPVILRTITKENEIKMNFIFKKDKPIWTFKHINFTSSDKDIYNNIIQNIQERGKIFLNKNNNYSHDTYGTLWEIPINNDYKDIFDDENTIKNICQRFWNIPIYKKEIMDLARK